jgi:hypothetical protein
MSDLPAVGPCHFLGVLVLFATVLASCGGRTEASGSPPPPGAGPSAAAASSAPSEPPAAPRGFLDREVLTACLDLGPIDCSRARDLAAGALAAGDPPARYIQIGPFGCLAGEGCPPTLVARPEGDVTIEFDGGQGITVHLKLAPDGSFDVARDAAQGVSVLPSSAAGALAGPSPFTLGHCGIFSGIDAAGSWWDPVGSVSMASGEAVNATAGVLTTTDPNHAIFTTPAGFSLQLQRRTGPKLLPFCM